MKRCQRLGLLESGCHVSMPAMRSVVLIARHGAAHSKPQSPMAPDHTSACTLSRSWHHHACMRGPCSTSHVCYASSLNNSSAQPPQLQHGKELIDVLAPLPLLFPALLGAAAVAVFRAASGAAAGASLPMWCIAVCLVPTVIVHIAVPLVDYLLGEQPSSIKPSSKQATDFSARLLPFLWVLSYLGASMASYAAAATYTAAVGAGAGLTSLPLVVWLLGLAAGASFGIGNAAAHELIHSRNVVHQAAGQVILMWMLDWQYSRSHHHHHLHVGTPVDHAWARKGQNLYTFIPQYKLGGWRVAWEEEAANCKRRGHREWGPHNRCLLALLGQACLAAAVWGVWGLPGLVVHVVAGVVAQLYLSDVDYLLHYGLERPSVAPGRYTPASAHNSFNSGFAVEGAALFKVLHHSDHHATASKSFNDLGLREAQPAPAATGVDAGSEHTYQEPRLLPGVPLSAMTLVALIPPLWFSIVDPVVDRANAAHAAAVRATSGK